jgi:hypothetical protein
MTDNISFEEIMFAQVGQLINALYLELKDNDADAGDKATLKFGAKNFEATVTVMLKDGDIDE